MRRRPMLPDVRRDVALRPTPVRTFEGRVEALPAGIVGATAGRDARIEIGDDADDVQHIALYVQTGQTASPGGTDLGFDRTAGPPSEVYGFARAVADLVDAGVLTAVPMPATGDVQVIVDLRFYDTSTGDPLDSVGIDCTLELTRSRGTGEADWPAPLADTDLVGFHGPVTGRVRIGDEVGISLDPSEEVGISGIVYIDVWSSGPPTSPPEWEQVYIGDVWGIYFDGSHWWGTEGAGNTVTQYDGNWTAVDSFEADFAAARVRGVTILGGDLWLGGDSGGATTSGDRVKQYGTDGVKVSEFETTDAAVAGVTTDGTDLFVMGGEFQEIMRYDTAGTQLGTIALPAGSVGTYAGLAFYAGQIYVANSDDSSVQVYETDGTLADTIDVSGATASPTGVFVTLDGTLYVSEDGVGVWRRR